MPGPTHQSFSWQGFSSEKDPRHWAMTCHNVLGVSCKLRGNMQEIRDTVFCVDEAYDVNMTLTAAVLQDGCTELWTSPIKLDDTFKPMLTNPTPS